MILVAACGGTVATRASSGGGGSGAASTGTSGSGSSGDTTSSYQCVCYPGTCGYCDDISAMGCGTCPAGQVCDNLIAGHCCTPKTCAEQGFDCGTAGSGCLSTTDLDCGTCTGPETCGGGGKPNVCGCCGGPGCGTCPAGTACSGGICKCAPKTCADLGFDCGAAPDGCGGTLYCGTCACPTPFCGVGVMPNVCGLNGCKPKTCADLGVECGVHPDGCACVVDCGTCPAPQTCGGAGVAGKCG